MLNTFYLMSISSAIDNFKSQFDLNFIQKDRWRYMLQGLGNTLTITAVAAIIGIVLGVIIAAVRSSYDKNEESLKLRGGFSYHLLKYSWHACCSTTSYLLFHHLCRFLKRCCRCDFCVRNQLGRICC